MTPYLFDTTALIDYSKGYEPAISRMRAMVAARDELGTCAVNVAEFYAGVPRGTQPAVDEFIDALAYWEISFEAAIRAGEDRCRYARQGQPLSTADVLIAAVARERGAIIVTDNVKDFPMPDVEVLSLRR